MLVREKKGFTLRRVAVVVYISSVIILSIGTLIMAEANIRRHLTDDMAFIQEARLAVNHMTRVFRHAFVHLNADVNEDGIVNHFDLALVAKNWGAKASDPVSI